MKSRRFKLKRKILSILFALVLVLSFSLIPAMTATVSANGTTYIREGSSIEVTSLNLCELGAETEGAFNAEPETLVVDGEAFDAQSRSQLTIEGEVSDLVLGVGWVNTAYVEIGLRPEATMNARNAGVYLIALNGDSGTEIHLQDYTGGGRTGGVISITKDTAFRYKITLTPSGDIGGTATLQVWVDDALQSTQPSLEYGYASTWEEDVAGALNENFSNAHLFYSIIADRRGVADQTYNATVGDITIDDTLHVGAGQQFTTIQAAINFANLGDTINVAAGTYNENISIDKSLTLQSADGAEETTINGGGITVVTIDLGWDDEGEELAETVNFGRVEWVGEDWVSFGFTVTNGIDTGIYVDEITNGSSLTISGNMIVENTGRGIDVTELFYGSALTIEGNIVGTNSEGIHINNVDYGSSVTIKRNAISQNSYDGISIYEVGFDYSDSDGFYETEAQYYALFQQYGANTVTIEGNMVGAWEDDGYSFYGNGNNGIYVAYIDFASILTIQDNTISENSYDGIYIYEVGSNGYEFWSDPGTYPLFTGPSVVVQGNTISENYSEGIYIYEVESSELVIGNNNISENDECGIYIEYVDDGSSAHIFDNTISENYYQGISIDEVYDGSELVIDNNNISENDERGIYIDEVDDGSSAHIFDNTISKNYYQGIYINEVYDGSELVIGNNNISNNDAEEYWDWGYYEEYGEGIYIEYVYDGSSAHIFDNTILANDNSGIYIYEVYDGSELVIGNNNISNNDSYGIDIEDVYEGSELVIGNNNISNNEDDGICIEDVDSGSSLTIDSNLIGANLGDGIEIDDVEYGSSAHIFGNTISENSNEGIQIYDVDSGSSLTIDNNLIGANLGDGIYIEYVEDGSSADIHFNDIVGNSYGVDYYDDDDSLEQLDATLNWWGTTSEAGIEAMISGSIIYTPWLPAPLNQIEEGAIAWQGLAGDDPAEVELKDEGGNTIANVDISGAAADAVGTIIAIRYSTEPEPDGTPLFLGTGTTGVVFVDILVTGYTSGTAHITVPYADVNNNGWVDNTDPTMDETTLELYYWDKDTSSWCLAESIVVDAIANTVSGDIPVIALQGTPCGLGGYCYPPSEARVVIDSILHLSNTGEDIVELTIDTNTAFLGAVTIDLTFDNMVVEVLGGENSGFGSLTVNLDYAHFGSTQTARFVAYQTGGEGVDATDSVVVAVVRLEAVGSTMESSPLTLSVVTLKDNKGGTISFTLGANDSIAIVGGVGDADRSTVVDVYDCVYTACAIAGFPSYILDVAIMDVDRSDAVDAYDCTYLARHIAGILGYEELGG